MERESVNEETWHDTDKDNLSHNEVGKVVEVWLR
jgi:hypothetical protein